MTPNLRPGALLFPLLLSLVLTLVSSRSAAAEILVRWDQSEIPSPQSLGISTVVVPAADNAVIRRALGQGYRVLVELDGSALTAFRPPADGIVGIVVTGTVTPAQLIHAEKAMKSTGVRILTVEDRGKWPHIRTNWVTKNKDVLQVTSRTAQPWIENNAALVRISQAANRDRPFVLTYPWKPITLADEDEGPALENYLVAIAETGSVGGDLLLPLHTQFQRRLLLGHPQTRLEWAEIRRYIEFFSWNLPNRYKPVANIGVVTAEPARSFEVMNLLLRHNLPFELVAPTTLQKQQLGSFELLLVLDQLKDPDLRQGADFANRGGVLVIAQPQGALPWRAAAAVTKTDQRAVYAVGKGRVMEVLNAISDPSAFALELRQLLGSEGRVIDIWNGITVLATPYKSPDGESVLVTALNYAHEPLPVQLRIRGTFSLVHYESPEESLTLLPYQHRGGFTEFVVPALRVAGRIFLGK